MKKIAFDAMGGDHAPKVTVAGAVEAAKAGVYVLLVGQEDVLKQELLPYGVVNNLEIVHASDVITMNDHASDVRRRPESSINVCTKLVKEGKADAAVSMGHSGATMASALFTYGRLKGIDRPAILSHIPSQKGVCFLLDVGANADVKPQYLQQWGVLASHYVKAVYGKTNPSVGLLSIGEEEHKGSQLVLEAHALLKTTPNIYFYGNVEGKDIFAGTTDIVVTDGFTGNVVLKLAEGEAKVLFGWIKDAMTSSFLNKLAAAVLKPAFKQIAKKIDPSEHGASVLIGVKGLAFIGHGSADAKAVKNALLAAQQTAESNVVGKLEAMLGESNVGNA